MRCWRKMTDVLRQLRKASCATEIARSISSSVACGTSATTSCVALKRTARLLDCEPASRCRLLTPRTCRQCKGELWEHQKSGPSSPSRNMLAVNEELVLRMTSCKDCLSSSDGIGATSTACYCPPVQFQNRYFIKKHVGRKVVGKAVLFMPTRKVA